MELTQDDIDFIKEIVSYRRTPEDANRRYLDILRTAILYAEWLDAVGVQDSFVEFIHKYDYRGDNAPQVYEVVKEIHRVAREASVY